MSEKPENQMKRRIAPGLWIDMNDRPHFSIPEILAHCELPNTPENFEFIKKEIYKIIDEKTPDMKVIYREKPDA